MKDLDPTNVSTAYLAECLGMTRDGVTRLDRGGVIQQNGIARGKYNLYDAIPAYLTYMKESKGDESNVKLLRQRERKLRLQNDKTEAGLVKASDAAEIFATYAATFRRQVESSLAGLAEQISKTDSPAKSPKRCASNSALTLPGRLSGIERSKTMSVQIGSVDFHSGAPAWLTTSYRYPGYRIRGRGFGTRPGVVTIDGEAQKVAKWTPDLIIIAMSDPNPIGNRYSPPVVTVTRASARQLAANDAYYVMAA